MSNGDRETDSDRADAAGWAARIESGAMTDEAWTAFSVWIAAPGRLEAFEAMQRRLALIDAAVATSAGAVRDRPRQPAVSSRRWGRAPVWGAGLAAGLAVAAAAVVFVAVRPPVDLLTITATAPAQAFQLPDRSVVTLRKGSHLEARFGRGRRAVRLAAGSEATFDVAKDASKPFVIDLGGRSVRVVGTAFDIVYRPQVTRVSVARGIVEVSGGGPHGTVQRLTVGQAVTIRDDDIWTRSTVRPQDVGAWREQRLFFNRDSLDVVANSIAEATDVRVAVRPAVRSLRFTGILRLGSAAEMARTLELYLPVRARVSADEIVVDRRRSSEAAPAED